MLYSRSILLGNVSGCKNVCPCICKALTKGVMAGVESGHGMDADVD